MTSIKPVRVSAYQTTLTVLGVIGWGLAIFLSLRYALAPTKPTQGDAAISAPIVHAKIHPKPLSEHYSEDGRVICLQPEGSNLMGCLPVWMLDRPSNWVVLYPPVREKKAAK